MSDWFNFNAPNGDLRIQGIRFVGFNAGTGKRLLFTLGLIVAVLLLGYALRALARVLIAGRRNERLRFWTRQGIHLFLAIFFLFGIIAIWFSEPAKLGTFLGLVTAGVAFALQRVITAFAAYVVILRGNTFSVGDRIVMGGVRGDVIALGFMQTTIMEMGQPPPVQNADPAMWVASRQYTGRIVTVTNDKIFDTPVFNYTRDFPYLWEEIRVPVGYSADRHRAEQILLNAADRHSIDPRTLPEAALAELERRFFLRRSDIRSTVYWRLTDNWLELTVRFLTLDHGVRSVKDAMARDILAAFDAAHISIASATYEIVGLPPLRIENPPPPAAPQSP